ncbi:MspA family porin [Nocardia carnea]|uniref:MspA family porin n=1 Tax=Nocardia carnea TaxID=37328 RepID=UPI002457D3BA|nr:MspA family porin [Nocardia carnea]
MIKTKMVARAAGACLTAATAIGLLSTGAAHADTFIPLPGGEISQTLGDGTVVTVRLVGESATINPSLGSTPLHRNAWVSGTAEAVVTGQPLTLGKIRPGYVVGCQVNIGGGGMNSGAGYSSDWEGSRPNPSGSLGGNLSLGPGEAQQFFILDQERADPFGESVHNTFNPFRSGRAGVSWKNSTIALSGCAGYAQARAFVRVEVDTEKASQDVTLWGQPFSLG